MSAERCRGSTPRSVGFEGELRADVNSNGPVRTSTMSGAPPSQPPRQTLTLTSSGPVSTLARSPSSGSQLSGTCSVSHTMRLAEPQSTVHAPSTTRQVAQPFASFPISTVFAPSWKFVVKPLPVRASRWFPSGLPLLKVISVMAGATGSRPASSCADATAVIASSAAESWLRAPAPPRAIAGSRWAPPAGVWWLGSLELLEASRRGVDVVVRVVDGRAVARNPKARQD